MEVQTQQIGHESFRVLAERNRYRFPRVGIRSSGIEERVTVQRSGKGSLDHVVATIVSALETEYLVAVLGALSSNAQDARHVRESANGCHGAPAQPAGSGLAHRRRRRRRRCRGEGVGVIQGARTPRFCAKAEAGSAPASHAAAGLEDLAERGPELVVLEGVDPRVEAAVEDGQQREVVPHPGADVNVGEHLGQETGQIRRPQHQEHPDDQGQRLGVLGVLDDEPYPQVVVHRVLHGGDGSGVMPSHHEDPKVAHRDGQASWTHDGAQEQDVGAVVQKLERAGLKSSRRIGFSRKPPGEPAQRQRSPDDDGGVYPGQGDEDPDLPDGHDRHVLEGAHERRVAVVGDGGQRQNRHAARRHQDAVGSQAQQQVAHLTDTKQVAFVTHSTRRHKLLTHERERQ